MKLQDYAYYDFTVTNAEIVQGRRNMYVRLTLTCNEGQVRQNLLPSISQRNKFREYGIISENHLFELKVLTDEDVNKAIGKQVRKKVIPEFYQGRKYLRVDSE